jgi:monooxygenase
MSTPSTPETASAGASSEVEHLDVIIIGAGLSGIDAAWHVQEKCGWASYAVFEARGSLGGTWDLFRYPGIRSDSDMYTLGYSFRPWRGDRAIADGGSILEYLADTATEFGIDAHIRFHHRITAAAWSSDEARWHVTAERTDTGEELAFTCGFLFACTGYYRYDRGYLPALPGMDDFAGTLVHPQFWPEHLDVDGKRVVVVGSGATAITLVPALASMGAQVTMLQRSPTWVVSLPAAGGLSARLRSLLPIRVSGPLVRWLNALKSQGSYFLSRRRPDIVRKALRKGLEHHLPDGYDIDTHFTPRYDPWDQRLCVVPDADLFTAIADGSATVVTDTIDTFTTTGIRCSSGEHLDADIIVTATGLDLLFLGGMDLTVDGEPVDPATRLAYKGMMLDGVPNLAMVIGYVNASWTLKADLTCEYACRLLNHLRSTGQRQCTPVSAGAEVSPVPLMSLQSGYIERAAQRMPRQGTTFPWRVDQSYLRDYRAMRRSPVDDGAMQFTNPALPRVDATRV